MLAGGIPASQALADRLIAAGHVGMRVRSFATGASVSTRRAEIEAAVAERGGGDTADNQRLAQRAAPMTRAAKRDVDRRALRESWERQAAALGFDARGLAAEAMSNEAGRDASPEARRRGVFDREVDNLIITPRTLPHRRTNRSKLTVENSDRAVRVARAIALAEKTFVNRDKADRWLRKHLRALGGRTPMEFIRTDAGARIVENLLARVSWGAPA